MQQHVQYYKTSETGQHTQNRDKKNLLYTKIAE